MALRKNIPNSTKYYYFVVMSVHWAKAQTGMSGLQHLVQTQLYLKDNADPNFVEIENSTHYEIPVGDTSPLRLEMQNQTNANVASLVYDWLKANVALYSDFEDA